MIEPAPWEMHASLGDLHRIYEECIRRYGGEAADPKPGCVESVPGGRMECRDL